MFRHFRWFAAFLFATVLNGFAQSVSVANGRLSTVEETLKQHNVAVTKPALLNALSSPDGDVRYLAAQKLAQDGAKDAIPDIAKALASEKVPGTKINVAFALAQLGDETGFLTLTKSCTNDALPVHLRLMAATYLLNLQNESCLETVVRVAQAAADFDSRTMALSLLPRFHNVSEPDSKAILNSVTRALLDPNPAVRLSAGSTLVALGNSAGISDLERAVAAEQDETVRKQLTANLEKLQNIQLH